MVEYLESVSLLHFGCLALCTKKERRDWTPLKKGLCQFDVAVVSSGAKESKMQLQNPKYEFPTLRCESIAVNMLKRCAPCMASVFTVTTTAFE